ncbi:MAG: hypothetical protein JRE64_07675 [Deltaproteobacteria bacterium]|nr:hypothetical protein [Deltaproteobacteria bacterium]
MHQDFELMFDLMDRAFRDYENPMPNKPVLVNMAFGMAFRYREKDIYQAIILKLARAQSAVRAAYVLLKNGFLQEQAILHRVIDETNEDILFLAYAVTNDTITDLHNRFLDAFWEEEIDESGNMIDSKQKRPMIPRKKIRAYIAGVEGVALDPSRGIELSRTLSKTYSGFVHGASPQIMDMYVGNPPRFHTNGMLGTPRMQEYADDLWNYMYRTFLSHIVVAKVLGAEKHVEILSKYKLSFENNANKNY